MTKAENYKKINMVLNEIQRINSNNLLAAKKYSDSRQLFYDATKKINLSEHFLDTQLQDSENLQRIIRDKIEALNQLIGIIGELYENMDAYNI